MAVQVENTAPVAAPTGATISSGTASEAMIRAAEAASSPATPPAGVVAGDTPPPAGDSAPPVTPPAAATVQPVTEGSATPPVATRGEAPEPRIVAAVRNARDSFRTSLGLPEDFNPEDVRGQIGVVAEMRRDPVAFYHRLGRELNIQPVQAAPPAEVIPPWKMPEAALHSEDGKGAYSAEQVQEIVQHAKDELMGVVKPLQDERVAAQQAQTLRERMDAGKARIDSALAHAQTLPHFEENKDAIASAVAAIPYKTKMELGAVACLHMAYNHVLATKVFPSINEAAEKRVREENERKAATSTGTVRPSGGSGDGKTASSPTNPQQLAARMEQMAASGQFG